MFPLVKEYGGHRIERRPPGFEFTPVLLGKITTYVAARPDGALAIFAFMYSFLVTGGPDTDEDDLARRALDVIQAAIDSGSASGGSEHTYVLELDEWREVSKPAWWVSVAGSLIEATLATSQTVGHRKPPRSSGRPTLPASDLA